MWTDWLEKWTSAAANSFPEGHWLSFAFNVKALVALTFVSLICGAVGALVVGNRMSFFSDALAHCAFAGVALGVLVALAFGSGSFESPIIPIVTVSFGIVMGIAIAFVRERTTLASDTVIAVFFAGAIGFGGMLFDALPRSNLSPESFLFGSPLSVYAGDIVLLLILSVMLAFVLWRRYNHFVLASFNPSLARSRRIPLRWCNYLFIVLLALIVNLCLRAVGVLLINAMLVVPAATAANVSRNLRQMFWNSVALSLTSAIGGLWLSNHVRLPIGMGQPVNLRPTGTIVVLSVTAFFLTVAWRVGGLAGWRLAGVPCRGRGADGECIYCRRTVPRPADVRGSGSPAEIAVEKLIQDFIVCFTSILYEAMPFIVLGAIIAGILEEVVPQQFIARVVPKNKYLAIGMSAFLGLVFPMCECGIVPVMRRLLRKGLPLSCCTAYLLAGPIINPVVILSTWVAFQITDNKTVMQAFAEGRGPMLVFLRVLGAYLIAVTTSLIVHQLYRKHGNDLLKPLARPDAPLPRHNPEEKAISSPAEAHQLEEADEPVAERKSLWQRLGNIAETALHDFVDITLFLILGALLAASARMYLTGDDVSSLSNTYPILAILGLIGLAIVLCLCSEADAFVAASFTELQPAAKLSFLVLGPMLDLKLYMMYTRVFRPRLIWTVFGCVIVFTTIYTAVVHYLWAAFVVPPTTPLPG